MVMVLTSSSTVLSDMVLLQGNLTVIAAKNIKVEPQSSSTL